jgi:hypothetical protein
MVGARVRLALGGAADPRLSLPTDRARCARGGGHAEALGAVSAVRLPTHPDLPDADRPCDEYRSRPSPVASGRSPGATTATTSASRRQPAASGPVACRQSCLGVRLRVRCVHEWADAEVSDGDRRVHARVPGDRPRGRDFDRDVSSRYSRSSCACTAPRATYARTTARSSLPGDLALAPRRADRDCVQRSGQAMATWRRRIVQREVPRRVSELAVVSQSRRSHGRHRTVAASLQRGPTAFEPQIPHTDGIQNERINQADRRHFPVSTGPKNPVT